ncbi:hypothetical protein D3C85_709410 [compost metagenome]
MAIAECGIRRDDDAQAQPLGEQALFQVAATVVIEMREGTTIAVPRLTPEAQSHPPLAGLHQLLQTLAGCLCVRFGRPPLASDLRRVQTDQANASAIGQPQRVAIDDLPDFIGRELARNRAGGLERKSQDQKKEKGAC